MTDLWTAVKDLPLTIESSAVEVLLPAGATDREDFSTTHLLLRGRGEEGLGEQVGMPEDQEGLRTGDHPLAGSWATLADFLSYLDTIDMWPEPPEHELQRNWRRWTFESAALDLALRQAATSLPEVLGRVPRPVRFVTSFGLGDPPDGGKVADRRRAHLTVGFKLDVAPSWTQEIMDRVAAVDGVGRLQELSRLYAHCESAGIRMYNGGMGELGAGRGQAQLLAALFHPDAPNDIAPSGYNLETLPPGLPASPLDPAPGRGFRRR